jgi:hypothetical protein
VQVGGAGFGVEIRPQPVDDPLSVEASLRLQSQ